MRSVVVLIFASFALWAGYWVYGQNQQTKNAIAWFDAQQDNGWVADYDALEVKGFPNRFDTVFEDITLADPKSGWAWSAQNFQILSLSYRPNHVIFVFPPEHEVRTPRTRLAITNQDLRGSTVFERGTDYELNRSSFVGQSIAWRDPKSEDTAGSIEALRLATRKTKGDTNAHDISLELTNADLGAAILPRLAAGTASLAVLDKLVFDATAKFDGAWDRPSLAGSGPDLTFLDLRNLSLEWENMRLRLAGDLEIDRFGYPSGSLDLRAENWEVLVSVATANGFVPRDIEDSLIAALQFVSRLSGTADSLDVKLRFSNRQAYLGPVPIGDAPILWPVERQ
ncbi:MAG: DUF2125 domain-containing protein [Pseudomonadota bacterium]